MVGSLSSKVNEFRKKLTYRAIAKANSNILLKLVPSSEEQAFYNALTKASLITREYNKMCKFPFLEDEVKQWYHLSLRRLYLEYKGSLM